MCGPEIDEGEVPDDNEFQLEDIIRPNTVIISRFAYNPSRLLIVDVGDYVYRRDRGQGLRAVK